jgi:hypothetical protein
VDISMRSVRRIISFLVFLLLVQATLIAGDKSKARTIDSKQDLINLENEWWTAFKTRDKAVLERILADEFRSFNNAAANPETKRQWIDGVTDASFRIDSYSIERMDVIVAADTAVVAVHYSVHRADQDIASSERKCDLDTFVRRNGHWQALATAAVPVRTGK